MKATAVANSNIAFIKYWGKRDDELKLPMNPSLSMTLDEQIFTVTTVDFYDYDEDILILNDKREKGEKLDKVSTFLDLVRTKEGITNKAKVVSMNSFPTGSGIASSASGFAALAVAAAKAAGMDLNSKELSALARRGSGSACRSIYGGFVFWENDYAVQLKDEHFWDELRDIIVIVDNKEKEMSSRAGMKQTVLTSKRYQKRIKTVGRRIAAMKKALLKKEFSSLCKLIMVDSDEFHACLADTKPKIVYLNAVSLQIKKMISALNKKKVVAGYTFDAGPNAHIITLEKNVPDIVMKLKKLKGVLRVYICKPGNGVRYTTAHLF